MSGSARLRRLTLAAVATLGLVHAWLYVQPFDDSFITYRYARNLARGWGFAFNAGERVEGYSSFLWTVGLAAGHSVGVPLLELSQVLSLALALALLPMTWSLHQRLREPAQQTPVWLQLAAPLWLGATGTWAYYAGTGMETSLFSVCLLGTVLSLSHAQVSNARALGAGLLLAAAAMTRPEGLGYALGCVAALGVARADRRLAWCVLAGFASVFVPYFVWRYQYFGFLAPNTYYAKASPSLALRVQGLAYLEACLVGRGFIIPVIAVLADAVVRFRVRALRLCAAITVVALASSCWVGGDAFLFYRFLLPAMPCAYAVLAGMLERGMLESIAWTRASDPAALIKPQLRAGAVALLMAALLLVTETVPVSTLSRARHEGDYVRATSNARITADYFEVGEFLRSHVRQGSLLALNAAGVVPFVSDLPSIDMLGLTDLHIAHAPIELGHGVLGHEKHDASYVLSRNPDVIILGLPQLAPSQYGPFDLSRWLERTSRFLPGDRALLDDPRFRARYRPARFATEHGILFVFLRRDAEDLLQEPRWSQLTR